MNAAERRRFILEVAAAITDDPETVQLLGFKGGRKERIGTASLAALEAVAAANPESFDRRAFCVRTSPDLLVLDADSADQAEVARQVAARAAALGLGPVVISSGGRDHIHVLVRVIDVELRRVLAELAAEGDVDVRTGNWLRPPLSVHPSGVTSELLEPSSPKEALARLQRPAGAPAPARLVAVATPAPARTERRRFGPPLSAGMLRVLRDGDGSPDRSRTLQRVVTAMVDRGWTIDAAWDLLATDRAKCAAKLHEKIRRRGEDVAFAYLERCWVRAEEFCAKRPAVGAANGERLEALDRLEALADSVPWTGPTGSSEWMVLHCLLAIAQRAGVLTPTASERQLAEAAALSRTTVSAALWRLREAGWVVQIRRGSGDKGTLWEFGTPLQAVPDRDVGAEPAGALGVQALEEPLDRTGPPTLHPLTTAGGVRTSGMILSPSHDAYRAKALGTLGYRVLRYLRMYGPAGVGVIAAALGAHPRSVARVMQERLGAVGLVERLSNGLWGILEGDLEAALRWAAEKFATVGSLVRQRELHAEERAEYKRSPLWGRDRGWWDQWESQHLPSAPTAVAA